MHRPLHTTRALTLALLGTAVSTAALAPTAEADVVVVRYNTNGSLDQTFATGGILKFDVTGQSFEWANAVKIDANGKLVVAGTTADQMFATRINTNGTIDGTFGFWGFNITDFASASYEEARDIAIASNGKIVLGGLARTTSGDQFALVRMTAAGALDTSFDTDGKVLTNFASSDNESAYGVAIQSDGKIVAAGMTADDFAVSRYLTSGALDTTFDGDGKVLTDFSGGRDNGFDVAIGPNGRIVVGGAAFTNGYTAAALTRYNANGSLDTTFGSGGKQTISFPGGGNLYGWALAVDSSNRPIIAGTTYNPDESAPFGVDRKFWISRRTTTGAQSFSTFTDFASQSAEYIASLAIGPNGKFLVAGATWFESPDQGTGARYNTDGTLDTTFDGDGKILFSTDTPQTPADCYFNGVAVDSSNRMIAVGYCR